MPFRVRWLKSSIGPQRGICYSCPSGATAPKPKTSGVEEALKAVEPDALSPKQALEVLYALKQKLNS